MMASNSHGAKDSQSGRPYYQAQLTVFNLPHSMQLQLYQQLSDILFHQENLATANLAEIRERRFGHGICCPHCRGKSVRHGTYQGHKQRYLCQACGRTFGDFTCSPLHKTHYPDKWPIFLEHFFLGYSLRKSAEILKVRHDTLFYWRHKILAALCQVTPETFSGILEADETYLLYSQKGQRRLTRRPRHHGAKAKQRGISREWASILTARDREHHTRIRVTGRGQMSQDKAKELLGPALANVTALCTDDAAAYRPLEVQHIVLTGVNHERVKGGIYHIQNVNAFHSSFKKWVTRFYGVATKYLNNYLEWFHFLQIHKFEIMPAKILELLVASCQEPLKTTRSGFRLAPCPFASPEEDPRHLTFKI